MQPIDQQALQYEPQLAVPSSMLFAPGDKVKCRNPKYPFWMTVKSVNERTGFYLCYFGASSNQAGNFRESELEFSTGNEYVQPPTSTDPKMIPEKA